MPRFPREPCPAMDLVYLALLVLLVAASVGFMRLCDHLRGRP